MLSTDKEMDTDWQEYTRDARAKISQKAQKSERTEITPEESTEKWKLALINDWTKTWFVGT